MAWEKRILDYDIKVLERSLNTAQVEKMYFSAFGRSAPSRSTKLVLLERIRAYASFRVMKQTGARPSFIVEQLGDRFQYILLLVGVPMFTEEEYKEALSNLYSVEINGTRSQMFSMLQHNYSKRILGEIKHG